MFKLLIDTDQIQENPGQALASLLRMVADEVEHGVIIVPAVGDTEWSPEHHSLPEGLGSWSLVSRNYEAPV